MEVNFFPCDIVSNESYAIVLLNTEIKLDSDFFLQIWNNASVRHAIDGGSNHWYEIYKNKGNIKLPELASGDFDSITKEAKTFLEHSNFTKVVETEDQDETDFTKGLKVLRNYVEEKNMQVERIIVILEVSGRLDQQMANFQTLYYNPFPSSVQTYLLGSTCLTWLLQPKKNVLHFKKDLLNSKCGIIPLNGPTKIQSTGLKWELTLQHEYGFKAVLSTSNEIVQDKVVLEPSDNEVLFTLEITDTRYFMHK